MWANHHTLCVFKLHLSFIVSAHKKDRNQNLGSFNDQLKKMLDYLCFSTRNRKQTTQPWNQQTNYNLIITEFQKQQRLTQSYGGHHAQTPSLSRATSSQLPRTVSRFLLSIFEDGDSTASLGELWQCLVNLKVGKVFSDVQTEPPVFYFVLVASCPVTGHIWKVPGFTFFPPSWYLYFTYMRSPWIFSSLQNFTLQKLYSRFHQKLCCRTYVYLASKKIFLVKLSFLSNKIIETNKIWRGE